MILNFNFFILAVFRERFFSFSLFSPPLSLGSGLAGTSLSLSLSLSELRGDLLNGAWSTPVSTTNVVD